jgi:CBS domain-containing protein
MPLVPLTEIGREKGREMASIRNRVVREVVALSATASCAEAARLMGKYGIGSIGVRRGGKIVGVLTERDLVADVLGRADPEEMTVGQAMHVDQPTVSPDATDRECAQLMRMHRTRHLAVKEGGAIVGVVSMLDLVDLVVEEKNWRIDQLETYIGGGRAQNLSQPISTIFHHSSEG